jgi:hypothetical protein
MILKKTLTKNLSRNHIKLINLLKNTHWKYNLKKQNEWFDLNAHKDDLHLMVFIKKKLIGYVHLSQRSFYSDKTLKNKKKYILFRNLLVSKKYRNLNAATLIMNSVNSYVKKKKLFSFLLCKLRVFRFYKKFNWIKMSKINYKLIDHSYSSLAMTYNFKKSKQKNMYFFSYNN